MFPNIRDFQLSSAIWALNRIVRTVNGLEHCIDGGQSCVCPQCIAKEALEQIYSWELAEKELYATPK